MAAGPLGVFLLKLSRGEKQSFPGFARAIRGSFHGDSVARGARQLYLARGLVLKGSRSLGIPFFAEFSRLKFSRSKIIIFDPGWFFMRFYHRFLPFLWGNFGFVEGQGGKIFNQKCPGKNLGSIRVQRALFDRVKRKLINGANFNPFLPLHTRIC